MTANVLPAGKAWPFTDPLLEQFSGAALLFDYDGDGDLDLLEVASTSQRLYRNDAGKFTDVTAQAGDLAKAAAGVGTGAVAGDYDNDGKPDLFILRYRASALYHNDGNGRFTDVTAKAKIPNYPYLSKSVAFVDYDHDGDLDLFIAGYADAAETLKTGSSVLPKDETTHPSNPLFTNMPAGTKSSAAQQRRRYLSSTRLLPQNSPALFRLSRLCQQTSTTGETSTCWSLTNKGVALWRNMRDGTFKDVAKDTGLLGGTYVRARERRERRCEQGWLHRFLFRAERLGGPSRTQRWQRAFPA